MFEKENKDFYPEDLEEFDNLLEEINKESEVSESDFSLDTNQMLSVESLEDDILIPKKISDLFEACKSLFKHFYKKSKNLILENDIAECIAIFSVNIHAIINFSYHCLKFLGLLSYFIVKCAIFMIQKIILCRI
ncbi:UNVERIFIED_CONTAM: hypothetical protein RMT77_007801 [Armadillidium vulgare]